MVIRSASFWARCRSSAASLDFCSMSWFSSSRRCMLSSVGSAPLGGSKVAIGSPSSISEECRRATSSLAARRSLRRWVTSAELIVGSSSISTSPAFTACPSRTKIPLTIPASSGWMTLSPPWATILPGAVATISILPKQAQAKPTQKISTIVMPSARPTGEGGVSTISRAAGRNSVSMRSRPPGGMKPSSDFRMPNPEFQRSAIHAPRPRRGRSRSSTDFMETRLHAVQVSVVPAAAQEVIVAAVFDDAAVRDRDDAVGPAHGRQAMGDDDHGTAGCDVGHIVLDRPLALVVERAGRFVEHQDARVHDQGARDRDALTLAARKAAATLANHGVVALGQVEDELMGAGELGRRDDPFERHAGVGQRDVVAHRAAHQDALLQHHAELAAQPRRVD